MLKSSFCSFFVSKGNTENKTILESGGILKLNQREMKKKTQVKKRK